MVWLLLACLMIPVCSMESEADEPYQLTICRRHLQEISLALERFNENNPRPLGEGDSLEILMDKNLLLAIPRCPGGYVVYRVSLPPPAGWMRSRFLFRRDLGTRERIVYRLGPGGVPYCSVHGTIAQIDRTPDEDRAWLQREAMLVQVTTILLIVGLTIFLFVLTVRGLGLEDRLSGPTPQS